MAALTFQELRNLIAPYAGDAGKCATSKDVARFAHQVMEYLLHSGSQSGVRKVTLLATQSYISLPPEVEIPLKVKIEHRVSEVWNKWASFQSASPDLENCPSAASVLIEDGTQTPLAYNLPVGGSVVGVMGTCEEPEATVLVQGKDVTGRPVYTSANGEQVPGELFNVEKDQIKYGQVRWGEITGIVKSKTNGYVELYAVDLAGGGTQYLASWSPLEEKPLYRRFKISAPCAELVRISMLCRIRLKDNYHDNELTPFDNSLAVILAAQRIQGELNNDPQTAGYKKTAVEDILDKEAGYKKKSGGPIDVFYPLSGGTIRNII